MNASRVYAEPLGFWPPPTKVALRRIYLEHGDRPIEWRRWHLERGSHVGGPEYLRSGGVEWLADVFQAKDVLDIVRQLSPQVIESAWRLGGARGLGPLLESIDVCTSAEWSARCDSANAP